MQDDSIRIVCSPKKPEDYFFIQKYTLESEFPLVLDHSTFVLLYIMEGKYAVKNKENEYMLEKGELALFSCDSSQQILPCEAIDCECYVLKISTYLLIDFINQGNEMDYVRRFSVHEKTSNKYLWKNNELKHSAILQILKSIIEEYETQKYAREIVIKLKIIELLSAILRDDMTNIEQSQSQNPNPIQNVISYMQSHYAEDMDEKILARKFGMSYSHFSRSFKKITGMTFRQYLNMIRINNAEQMLYSSDESVSRIAGLCGYNSVSYFSSVYRSIKGKSPYQVLKKK